VLTLFLKSFRTRLPVVSSLIHIDCTGAPVPVGLDGHKGGYRRDGNRASSLAIPVSCCHRRIKMVDSITNGVVLARNSKPTPAVLRDTVDLTLPAFASADRDDAAQPALVLAADPQVSPAVAAFVLAIIAEVEHASLDELCACLPWHPQPAAVILALVRAGQLRLDLTQPLSGTTQVWHAAA